MGHGGMDDECTRNVSACEKCRGVQEEPHVHDMYITGAHGDRYPDFMGRDVRLRAIPTK